MKSFFFPKPADIFSTFHYKHPSVLSLCCLKKHEIPCFFLKFTMVLNFVHFSLIVFTYPAAYASFKNHVRRRFYISERIVAYVDGDTYNPAIDTNKSGWSDTILCFTQR